MASEYLKNWTKRADERTGGFHLTHKNGNHTISFLPNKEKGGFDIKHSGKLVAHHPTEQGALKAAVTYFKGQHNQAQGPAMVNMSSQPVKKSIDPYAQQVTAVKGVSDRGIEARRGNLKDKDQVVAQGGYARVTSAESHRANARNYFRDIHNRIKAIKPNLPKSELAKDDWEDMERRQKELEARRAKSDGPGSRSNAWWREQVASGKRSKWETQYKEKPSNPKGVNRPLIHTQKDLDKPTTSEAGAYVKGRVARTVGGHGNNAWDRAGKKAQFDEAKKIHRNTLAEQKAMKKPNLPKSELAKAKIDEGKSIVEKVKDRNDRYFGDKLSSVKGDFKAGANKKMAMIRHKINMDAINTPKPNLPKSELNKSEYFKTLLKKAEA